MQQLQRKVRRNQCSAAGLADTVAWRAGVAATAVAAEHPRDAAPSVEQQAQLLLWCAHLH
jgi:hypothetical protein